MTKTTGDHEYFSTPISNTPITPSSTNTRVYITPTQGSSSSASSPATAAGHLILPQNAKVEARRRLNLDSAAMVIDQDGFKTPIKGGTKRKADFSSPSPKKCKIKKKDMQFDQIQRGSYTLQIFFSILQ